MPEKNPNVEQTEKVLSSFRIFCVHQGNGAGAYDNKKPEYMFNEYEPVKTDKKFPFNIFKKSLNVTQNNNDSIIEFMFEMKKGTMPVKEVAKYAKNFINKLGDSEKFGDKYKYELFYELKYKNNRTGKTFMLPRRTVLQSAAEFKKKRMLELMYDYDTEYESGMTYVKEVGKTIETNDCLYKCLKTVPAFKNAFKKPEDFKTFMGVGRNDKVPIDKFHLIEEHVKEIALYVYGDAKYISKKTSGMPIRLEAYEDHIELQNIDEGEKVYGVSNHERFPLIYERCTGYYNIYNAETDTHTTMKHEEFKRIKNNPHIYNGKPQKYILVEHGRELTDSLDEDGNVKKDEYGCDVKRSLTMEEQYKFFCESANQMKKATDGLINLYKTGSYNTTIQKLMIDLGINKIIPDDIDQHEANFLQKASRGAYTYAEKYEGIGYDYDFVSCFPSIMASHLFYIPIRKPSFEHLTELPTVLKVGIYRCIIAEGIPSFTYNYTNHYTHIDINYARKAIKTEKLDIPMPQIIIDGEENAMIYEGKRIQNEDGTFQEPKTIASKHVYSDLIHLLFKLKQDGVLGAKHLLSHVWGYLCRSNQIHMSFKSEKGYVLRPSKTITAIVYNGNENEYIISHIDKSRIFESSHARLKPFLLAKSREKLLNVIAPIRESHHMVFAHTDGFILTKPIENFVSSNELGGLKYKGYYKRIVINHSRSKHGVLIKPSN